MRDFLLLDVCVIYQAVGGNGAEQTVVSGSMDVLRPCWAVATSGVPVREQLFNVSICHYSHFNLFEHGELYRSYNRGSEMASLEVATPILIPRDDGHKHRKGSHGDVVFLTNRGEVCHCFAWLNVADEVDVTIYNVLFWNLRYEFKYLQLVQSEKTVLLVLILLT